MPHDPLTVQCLDCLAPAGTPCRFSEPLPGDSPAPDAPEAHAARYDAARWAAADHGVCALCGRAMIRLTDPDDAYHLPGVADDCPRLPDVSDWNTYARAVQQLPGGEHVPGHPGPQHWRPAPSQPVAPAVSLSRRPSSWPTDAPGDL